MKNFIKFTFCASLGLFPMTDQLYAQISSGLGNSSGSGSGGSGTDNTFLGNGAGQSNTSGEKNTFIGSFSGHLNTTGYKNVFLGWNSGYNNASGFNNLFIGTKTGTSNTTGYRNTYLGPGTGLSNISGNTNVGLGYLAGKSNQTGSSNVYLGPYAGFNNLGSNNVFIGNQAGYSATGSNKLYIDNSSTQTPLIYGDFTANQLTVNGGMEVTGHVEAASISASTLDLEGSGGINFKLRQEPIANCNEGKWHFEIGQDCGLPSPLPPSFTSPLMTFHHGSDYGTNVGIGTTSPKHAKLMIQDAAVPFSFKVSGANEQTGGLWRMYVVNGGIGFDANTGSAGNEFGSNYKRPLKMQNTGNYGRVAIANNSSSPQYELDVNGKVRATQYLTFSDKRLKKDIKPIKNAGELLSQLEGVTYDYRQDLQEEGRNLAEGKQIGFIAQEVQKVIPEIVKEDEEGYLSVSYQSLIPLLVENQKELKTQNDELKEELTEAQEANRKLELEIENIKAILSTLTQDVPTKTVRVENTTEELLFQNAPNPFSKSTSIEYNLPAHCAETQLLILNSNGQVIKSIENLEVGRGKVVLEANSLAPGAYHYSLVCQGQNLATKSMVIVR